MQSDINKDNTQPGNKWVFDKSVADCFDDMLERSIPQYHAMREACTQLALQYAKKNSVIIDIGCSRGSAISELVDLLGDDNKFIGLEISDSMLEVCRTRFRKEREIGFVSI